MKKFIKNVLLKIFSRLINESIELKTKEWNDRYKRDLIGHKEYLQNITDEFLENKETLDRIEKMLTPEKIREVTDPSLHEIKEKELTIRTRFSNTNKDEVTLLVGKPCWKDGRPDFNVFFPFNGKFVSYQYYNGKDYSFPFENVSEQFSVKEFIEKIFATEMISKIHTINAFDFCLTKSGALTWEKVLPKVFEAITSLSIHPDVETSNENESYLKDTSISE